MARMRTLPKAAAEIKAKDPETRVTVTVIRRWVKEGRIPSVKAGRVPLVNLDALEAYIEGQGN